MLSSIQKEIVETNEQKVIVMCAAASGKTRLITERTKYLIDKGEDPSSIAVITFTVAAAEEMRQRIGDYPGLFIGTIHALMYKWICEAGFSTEANSLVSQENFDMFFKFVTTHANCIHHIKTLIIDEAQDTDDEMWEVLLTKIEPKSFFICGDPRQVIYDGFRGVDPHRLQQMTYIKGVTTYDLNENYRNGSRILEFARKILYKLGEDYYDDSIPMREINGIVEESAYSMDKIMSICRAINSEDYNKWFILARTNKEVSDVIYTLMKYSIPCQKLERSGKTLAELQKALEDNKITVGTIHSAKGLERDNVIVIDPRFYNDSERRISYVAATRARNRLIWMPIRKEKYKKW